ncbi:MAG TPA: PDZ domain-containing protein [Candidatus Binatia bacterium]|nr:PDZ domain-containing protein [Candidatus Binatia bacterium]
MRTGNKVPILAFVVAAIILPALAQPGTEVHSGAYLGVQITNVSPQRASELKLPEASGALITYVDHDGPACHAGLLENDVVVGFDGSKVESPEQLKGLIHASSPQKTVTLTVVRDGQRKDVKVTLGSRKVMANAMPPFAFAPPPPPRVYAPDIEMPSFTVLSSRHGLVVESLSPQLADFFGVPRGHGVLVRSVEAGSPAAAAGIRAGDVILKVNNETVRDMADWQRGMRVHATKIAINLLRDKHEQTVTINLPSSGDNSRLSPGDWLDFETQAGALRDQMAQMRPELERRQKEMIADLGPGKKDLEQMRRDLQKSMKRQQKDMQKMSRDLAKSAKPAQKDMAKLRDEIQKSVPTQKDFDEMQRQIQESMPTQKDFEDMKRQLQASIPSQKDLDEMRKQIEESMKNWTPQFQQEMEQLKQQLEQHKLDWQQMMQDWDEDREY